MSTSVARTSGIRIFGMGYDVSIDSQLKFLTTTELQEFCLSLTPEDLTAIDEGVMPFDLMLSWSKRLPPGVLIPTTVSQIVHYRSEEINRYRGNPWLTYLAECSLDPGVPGTNEAVDEDAMGDDA